MIAPAAISVALITPAAILPAIIELDAIKFAVEQGNKSVWFKPTGSRKVLPHDKAKKVF